jgi:beta-N-acetylhexosaminidase
VLALKDWLAGQPQPELEEVACAEHLALAREVAGRAITLVRDEAGLLPLRLPAGARIAAVAPQPTDLTPADTSSYTQPALAQALRRHHAAVDEFVIPLNPSAEEVASLDERLRPYDLVVAATINATSYLGQAALVNGILARGQPLIAAALRMPYDLLAYPTAPTYLCTYSILAPSLDALADALWGRAGCPGRLPVSIAGLYLLGHGMDLATTKSTA